MNKRKEFIQYETLTLTLAGAFQRANIYSSGDVAEDQRKRLQGTVRDALIGLSAQYDSKVSEKRHCENIENLASHVTAGDLRDILRDGRFRIGIAQKALNLYLKYLWCLGWTEEPLHCPIDSVVLAKIGWKGPSWTNIDEIEKYREIIAKAQGRAEEDGVSVAQWELKLWNRDRA